MCVPTAQELLQRVASVTFTRSECDQADQERFVASFNGRTGPTGRALPRGERTPSAQTHTAQLWYVCDGNLR